MITLVAYFDQAPPSGCLFVKLSEYIPAFVRVVSLEITCLLYRIAMFLVALIDSEKWYPFFDCGLAEISDNKNYGYSANSK